MFGGREKVENRRGLAGKSSEWDAMRVKPEESKWTVEEKVGVSDTRRRERKKSVKEISTVEGQDTRRSRTDSLTVNE